jgi:ABC-2 type transport system permease protein
MLWYKAWLETRSRFLTCLATLTIFCAVFVGHAQALIRPEWHRDFNRLLFVTQQFLVIVWILAVVLLGMGGIVREKASGISSLTLSLPVSRTRLLGVRIATCVLEAITLGVVPWITILLISSIAGMPVILSQVGLYVLLLVAGGLVYLAMAILVSSVVAGEYTAPAVAFGLVLLSAIIFDAWLRPFNVWRLVTGDFYVDRNTYLLSAHPPWLSLLSSLLVAASMFLSSVKVIQTREF